MVHFYCEDEHSAKVVAGTCDYVAQLQGDRVYAEFVNPRRCIVYYRHDPGLEVVKDMSTFPVQTWLNNYCKVLPSFKTAMTKIYDQVCKELLGYWMVEVKEEEEKRRWIKAAFDGEERAFNFLISKDFRAFLTLLKWIGL
jgi:hypothetical protein